ncbi:MAG: dual specificity protein phosphatase family protein [Crocinitomicaceae bacterium]|nr:dual specificity protein phosphatase family protein [Crocinitomicaceae bacterium]
MKRFFLIALMLFTVVGTHATTRAYSIYPKNFHEIDEGVYRSGQPTREEMLSLKDIGFNTIINLRMSVGNKRKIKGTRMVQIRVPMKAQSITFKDMAITLRFIMHAQKPMLIHCLHGSDRAGCVVACYRMVFQNWKKEKAISEFQEEKYGYNKKWFPNILEFLNKLDVELLKQRVLTDSFGE